MRGGEKVLETLVELYPDATLFTLVHLKGSLSKSIEAMDIRTSFIQKLPGAREHYRRYLPLFPYAVERFDLRGYDLVISSSHCVAKGVKTLPGTVHIAYIFTPMRYIWDLYDTYFGPDRAGLFTRVAARIFKERLRRWDKQSSERVEVFAAISKNIASKVKRYYSKEAEVIYPPVDCGFFDLKHTNREAGDYYLMVSAFAPYKRLDLAVEAFNRLGLKLKIIGKGQDFQKIKEMAKANIELLGWQTDEQIREAYANCQALVFPGEEDFGIVPLEAMASGRPVIAYKAGGALETVVGLDDESGSAPTGVFFQEATADSLIEAVRLFENSKEKFYPEEIRANALRFDQKIFKKKIHDFIEANYKKLRPEEGL